MKALIAALLTGVLVSLGLFWLMQTMLMSNQQTLKKTENLNTMQFIRLIKKPSEQPKPQKPPEKKLERVQEVQEKQQPKKREPTSPKPVKIQKVLKQIAPEVETPKLEIPLPPAPSTSKPVVSASVSANAPAQTVDKGNGGTIDKGKGYGGGISTGVIALSRVPPKYPARAAKRHIEGWVKIEFTISTLGTVIDPVVVDAQPADIFDDAALKAISQWKFKQKIVDGVAVTQRAMQTLQFKLIQ